MNQGAHLGPFTVTLGYLLTLLSVQLLVPLWGLPPLQVTLFIIGLGMGLLTTPLMPKTLEEVAHYDAGAASGVYMTASQLAAALGVAAIGLIFAVLTANHGSALHAFVIALLVITLPQLPPVLLIWRVRLEMVTYATDSPSPRDEMDRTIGGHRERGTNALSQGTALLL